MLRSTQPFLPPRRLPAPLARVQQYWNSIKRGENALPFSDDVSLSALPELSDNLMLVDVFERPVRFRFSKIGQAIVANAEQNLTGKFADELVVRRPFEFFLAQGSVTVEARGPTFYPHAPTKGKEGDSGYSRLLVPTWGNGRVDMLICAVV